MFLKQNLFLSFILFVCLNFFSQIFRVCFIQALYNRVCLSVHLDFQKKTFKFFLIQYRPKKTLGLFSWEFSCN